MQFPSLIVPQTFPLFLPTGDFYWRSTDDTPIAKYVTVADLEVGTPYEVRVITKSAHGDAPSAVQTAHLGDTSIGSGTWIDSTDGSPQGHQHRLRYGDR